MSEGTATSFGKYELLERLGAGGMAIVYRARYTAAPGVTKPVVIKRVLGHYAEDPAFVEMFIHEARISVGLNHGNIVQVFDFGKVGEEYFLAMELVDGQPLSRMLKKAEALGLAQLPPPLAVSIASEMCKGLHHAHTRTDEQGRPLGLVHRDISPDNVLISYEGEVKISDFGIAKAQLAGRPVTRSGVVKGKYRYFSPEQAYAVPDLDARSDVYAVGVVLYRMLCGQLPADGAELAVMQRIANGQLTPPRELNPQLDEELVQILQQAMATRREERTPSAEALHLGLSQWAAINAPLFPVHGLKHLLGFLYEPELTAVGRPPQLPQNFREQVAMWIHSQQRRPARISNPSSPSWPSTSEPSARPPPRQRVSRSSSMVAPPTREAEHLEPQTDSTVPEALAVEELPEDTRENPVGQEPSSRPRAPGLAANLMDDASSGFIGLLVLIWRNWFVALGVVVVAIMGVKIATWFFEGPPRLEIRSEPPGALVTVDGNVEGTTPLTLEKIEKGEPHTVEMNLPGWKPWSRAFKPGELEERLVVTLERVQSEPRRPPPPAPPVQASPAPPSPAPSSSRFSTDKAPARFVLQENWHSFSVGARSFREKLNPKRTYTVWLSGSYAGDAPLSEQDLNKGLSPDSIRSSRVYVFVEGDGVSAKERLFMLSSTLHTLSNAQALHAFVLVGSSADRGGDQELVLHVRDNTSRKVVRRRLDTGRYANLIAMENRYSVRQLDPGSSYTLEIQPREGSGASSVAVLAVPQPGGTVEVSGQVPGDFRYALPPGRHTVKGARELWFTLPRWPYDGREVEMEVSLTP